MTTPDSDTRFAQLGLHPGLLTRLAELGYAQPTPIQEAALPAILAGRDVLALAQTGSGKTAAFALPLLQRLLKPAPELARGNRLRALVLVPTRELAIQVYDAMSAYAAGLPRRLKGVLAYGGVKINPQMLELRGGADLLVATPGRLLDLLDHNAIHLGQLETLVLDEADRMLGPGFEGELDEILHHLPRQRQTLLFSATFPDELKHALAPTALRLESHAPAAEPDIAQHVITVDKDRKNALLAHVLKTEATGQALVFVSAKNTGNRLLLKLAKAGIEALGLHGDLSQAQRERGLRDFRAGRCRVLIATDVAARGIDIPALPCVINFELPRSPNDYIHRIGRTGRAGEKGLAFSLICAEEEAHFRVIEKRIKQRLPRETRPGFEPRPEPGEQGPAPAKPA